MDNRFAMVQNGIVQNVAIAESIAVLEAIAPEFLIIGETEDTLTAWIGAEVINGRFKPPQPYPSWVWDKDDFQWKSPVPYPGEGGTYYWNEDEVNWEAAPDPEEFNATE